MASGKKWIDYYKLLGVPTSAVEREIKSAYKKLALKIHPDKSKSKDATEKFKKLSEAYKTLSNKNLRAKYDRSYKSKVSADVSELECFYPNFDSQGAPKDSAVFHHVFVTSKERSRGCTKRVKICRKFYKKGKVIHSQNKSFDVHVNAGCVLNSTVTVSRGGDRYPNRIPADLIFVIKEKPVSQSSSTFTSNLADGKHSGDFVAGHVASCGCELKIKIIKIGTGDHACVDSVNISFR